MAYSEQVSGNPWTDELETTTQSYWQNAQEGILYLACLVTCPLAKHDNEYGSAPPPSPHSPKVDEAFVLCLMRLREKMGLKPSRRNHGASNDHAAKPSTRANADTGGYSDFLWKSLGETAHGAAEEGGEGSGRGTRSPYWGGDVRARLAAYADTIRAGESALSPAVFSAEGSTRAEVRGASPWGTWKGGRLELMGTHGGNAREEDTRGS